MNNQLEGEAWCRLDDELLACPLVFYTRSTLFHVGVGRTSAARDTRKPRSSLVYLGGGHITYWKWKRIVTRRSCRSHKGGELLRIDK
jgi:hypothetical protein